MKSWSAADTELLRANYARMGAPFVARELGRNLNTVRQKAYKLGLHVSAERMKEHGVEQGPARARRMTVINQRLALDPTWPARRLLGSMKGGQHRKAQGGPSFGTDEGRKKGYRAMVNAIGPAGKRAACRKGGLAQTGRTRTPTWRKKLGQRVLADSRGGGAYSLHDMLADRARLKATG